MICNDLNQCIKERITGCTKATACIHSSSSSKNRTCSERNKRYNLINDRGLLVDIYHMDGGIIQNEQGVSKCDYLYSIKDSVSSIVLVELKGVDFNHSIEQIDKTLDILNNRLSLHPVYGRIVCGSVPNIRNVPSRRKLEMRLVKKFKGNLKIATNSMDEKYDSLGR